MEAKKFTILGSGNGARAWCAQIAAKGYQVTMWEPLEATEDYKKLCENKEMYLEGNISVGGKLENVTMDIHEAMKGSDIILIIVPSFAHEPIFAKMIPYLEDGQDVVIVPGNFGGLRLKKMMREAGVKKHISISELASMPYACRIDTYNKVNIFKKKFKVKIGSSPKASNAEIIDIMNDVFDGYVEYLPADNLLEIDLDNFNYTLHPFPVLLNYGEIEKNPSTYKHYMDGITPLISEQMEKQDEERLFIGKKLGLKLQSCLSQLKMYYGENDTKTIYDFVNSPETPYADLVGQNVRGRYLTEDVPGVVVPAMLLAHKVGMRAPVAELIVEITSQLHGVDYEKKGTTPEKLGVADMSVKEIVDYVS